jgi:ABC-type phosphate transport system auxiliary subunit
MARNNESAKSVSPDHEMPGPIDQTIDQVRELLFGHEKRTTDTRLKDLDNKMEARLDALHKEMTARFNSVENQLAELARDTENRRLSAISDIGAAISQLGATVQKMGNGHSGS